MLALAFLIPLLAAPLPTAAPQEAVPAPLDLRQTSIRVVEGIRGGIVGPPRYRTLLIHWDCNTGGYRALEQGGKGWWVNGWGLSDPRPVRARDVSEEEFRGITRRLLELGVLDLPLGDPAEKSSADAYRRDTALQFIHGGRAWMNTAPGGCVSWDLAVWPSLEEDRRFQLALDALESCVTVNELEPDPRASLLQFPGTSADLDALVAVQRLVAQEAIGKELDLQRACVQAMPAGAAVWLGVGPGCAHQLGEVQLQVDAATSEGRVQSFRRAAPGALDDHRAERCDPPWARAVDRSTAGWVSLGATEQSVTEAWGAPDERRVVRGEERCIYREADFDVHLLLRAGKVDRILTVASETPAGDEPEPGGHAPSRMELPRDALVEYAFLSSQPFLAEPERLLLRRRDGYGDEEGFVSASELARLRAALLASRDGPFRVEALRKDPCPLLEALGFSETALAEHQQQLVAAVLRPDWRAVSSIDVLPPAAQKRLAYDALAELLAERLVSSRSKGPIRIALELPGSPALSVELMGTAPFSLPLWIHTPDATWETADPHLMLELSVLMPRWQGWAGMADISEWSRSGLWGSGVWGSLSGPVHAALDSWGPDVLPADSFGPDLALDRWEIEPSEQGPRIAAVHAVATDPTSKVQGIRVGWPMERGAVASLFRQAELVAATDPTLVGWLSARPHSYLELWIDAPSPAAPEWSTRTVEDQPLISFRLFDKQIDAQGRWVRPEAWAGAWPRETLIVP